MSINSKNLITMTPDEPCQTQAWWDYKDAYYVQMKHFLVCTCGNMKEVWTF